MTPKMITCPSCSRETVCGYLSDEGICAHCGKPWHIEIVMVETYQPGSLVKEIDKKDSAAQAKAFVPQTT